MEEEKDVIIKEAILDAAGLLFQKWGLNKTTMEDIAKAAGKGKSTLYYYYKSKEEIFLSFTEREINSIINKSKQHINNETKAESKLKTYLLTCFEELKTRSNIYEIVRGEVTGNAQLINGIRAKFDTEEIKLIYDILDYGIKNNEFILYNKKELNIVSSIIVSAIRGLHFDLLIEKKFQESERINLLIEILLKGIKK